MRPRMLGEMRILDITHFLSGPQATLFLTALGAAAGRIDDAVVAQWAIPLSVTEILDGLASPGAILQETRNGAGQ